MTPGVDLPPSSEPVPGFEAEAAPPVIPGRFRRAMVRTLDDAMPEEWVRELGRWLYYHRHALARGGDSAGVERYNFELFEVDKRAPELAAPLRAKILSEIPNALAPCCVPDFDVRYVEMTATLHHHGGHFVWHDDAPGYDGEIVPSRRLSWTYYVHTSPKMFRGGELEFLDGTAVEPRCNRLTMFHPVQMHRVRPVECWSAELLHGRWALMGWIHGDPPPGWVERIPKLRDRPASG
ncbi:MAG TPA: 2OG-Fe(II) oxygenase [Verrucomicrobiae bacterium]|nr:2OG-Fe(II) oxygenase [Verrucomicrobiae bacterium]